MPTLRSESTLASGTRTNSTVTAPAGSATGDVILVPLECGGSSLVVPADPGGWTLVEATSFTAPDPWGVSLQMWLKVYDGAASWTFTHASRSTQARAQAWTGVDTTTPQDVAASKAFQNEGGAGGAAAIAPSITIATANAQGVATRGSWDGNAITPPAGWTERYDAPVLWVGDRVWSAPGATGAVSVPHGNGSNVRPWGVIMGALRPLGSGYSASVALGGSGALSMQAAPTIVRTAALTGSGSLAAVPAPSTVGSAALSGSGALSYLGVPVGTGVATLGGSGALTASVAPSVPRAVALSGSGALSMTASPTVPRAAALSGAGALTAAATPGATAPAALGGDGALTAAAATPPGAAAMLGTGTLTAVSAAQIPRAAALSGNGQLAATPAPGPRVGAALSGVGTLTSAALPPAGAIALTGSGQLTVVARPSAIGLAVLSGAGTLTAVPAGGGAPTLRYPLGLTLTVPQRSLELAVQHRTLGMTVQHRTLRWSDPT